MPATRSRTSTEQPAEVAAEEVKQVQAEDGTEIVPQVTVPPTEVVKSDEPVVVPESGAAAAEVQADDEQPAVVAEPVIPAAVVADVVTNGSAEVVAAETNGAPVEVANGSAVVTNGSAVVTEAAAEQESVPDAASEQPVSDAKRKSEVGDGDVVPDSTDVKKQKVVQSEGEAAVVAEESVTEATA